MGLTSLIGRIGLMGRIGPVSLVILGLCPGCAPGDPALPPTQVASTKIEGTTLSLYRTYSWSPDIVVVVDADGRWAPVGFPLTAQVERSIAAELKERGLWWVDANPDLVLTVSVVLSIASHADREGAPRDADGEGGRGSLSVTVIDSHTGQPVWGAMARGPVRTERSDEQARARIEAIVSEMFEAWPLRD